MSKKKAKRQIKCPWCSKMVALTGKNALAPHITPGAMQCVGSGMVPHPLHRVA